MENLEGWIESEVATIIVEAWRRVRMIIRESVYFAPNGKVAVVESTDFKPYIRDYLDFLTIIQNLIDDAIKFRDLDNDDDFETTTDIHLRIANQYQDSIDIKASKLENLASLFMKRGFHAEAAMCLIKVSELKLTFLKNPEQFIAMATDEDAVSTGNIASRDVSAGKLKKVASKGSLRRRLSQSSISARRHSVHLLAPPDELDTQEMMSEALLGHAFSRDGAIRSLKDTLDALDKAEMFEACPEILHRLLGLYQQKKDYENLCHTHEQFTDVYRKIIDYQKKFRAFGTYYRVGFYGRAFKDLDRKEFVYKEPKITMLPEITDRLKRLVEKKYKQVPTVFPDSGVVDPSSLPEEKLYLQITSLDVYFNEAEDKRRVTAYDRSINLTQFIFETPFTESGVAQAESVVHQRKRKTIVSVEKPFPHLLTRQLIVEKTEIVLGPLENSIETIRRRVVQIQKELSSPDISVKNLQSLLQGSVLVQVNAGVLAIAKGFLGDMDRYPFEEVTQLREALRSFLIACRTALTKNKQLIKSDQDLFQKELEKGYASLEAELNPYLL